MDSLSIWVILLLTTALVYLSVEVGYRMGASALQSNRNEKESSVSATVGSVLGLTAFVLAFTFGIVYQRYDEKKDLVREEATAIWTAFQRSDFLPEPDAAEAKQLLRRYAELHIGLPAAIEQDDGGKSRHVLQLLKQAQAIELRLWRTAVANAGTAINSDALTSYAEALNEVAVFEEMRIAAGLETRMHGAIWITLFILTFSGMLALGYQTGISGSHRSKASPILACSFGLVLTLIAALDRPDTILVSQQPLFDVLQQMGADTLQ